MPFPNRITPLLGVACLGLLSLHGAPPPSDRINPPSPETIPAALQRFVDDDTLSGAVTLVAQNGQVIALDAIGLANLDSKQPMRTDHLFWIASMTKPMTATAILMLQDEGRLSIEDPVERHLPEFRDLWMIREKSTDAMTLVPAPRPITIQDLLTHTSGLGDASAPRPDTTLASLVMACAQKPLQFPPGSRWQYSNSGINTLGRIVEVTAGIPFAEFLDDRIFKPLGMKDTTFWPSKRQQRRIATPYKPGPGGQGLEETGIYFLRGPLEDRNRTPYPAGGLFSTAEDLWRFHQLMLGRGSFRGKRLLSESAVEMMSRTQTGDLKTGFTDGMSWGLGFAVVKEPTGVTAMLAPGSFGHGGAYGTQGWIDPDKNMILVLMIQRAQLPNADNSDVRRVFQQTAVNALATPSRSR
jgi:CubicO group peptidase (beta-lactamase class C family)